MTQFQYLDGGNSEAQDKLAEAYLFRQASEGIANTGVISGLAVTQDTTASAKVKIGAGAGIVQQSRLNGADRLVNDTDVLLDVLTANPMGGVPRNDLIVFDQAALPNGLRAIIGTPNAVPTDPTVPATAIPLARLRNAASATTIPSSAIDDLRTLTAVHGGRVTVTGTAQRDRLVKSEGLMVWRTDVHRLETWDGTGWLTEVSAMDQIVATNGNGEFSLSTGLSSIKYANVYNGNGGIVRAGARVNITIARNTAGASYTGGTLVGIIYAADTKAPVSSTNVYIDWTAKGYA